jgi:anaerobic magnesium-protoporphyrin IX monomethyl ester cyclase
MNTKTDIVLINPGDKKQVYQGLGIDMAAVEPPYWIAAIAGYLRGKGFRTAVIDSNAENLSPEETAVRVKGTGALLAAVIVYGSQPSASTQNMTAAGKICRALKSTSAKVAAGGLHPTALPGRTLEELEIDFVIEGEGPYTLERLLNVLREGSSDYSAVPGLWYFSPEGIKNNPPPPLIVNLDQELPTGAWDLLPMGAYRAHNWHCFDDVEHRSPYAAIYTSLGCPYNCVFCCINALFGKPGIRYRSPKAVLDEIGVLHEKYGVKNLKIADELFIFKEDHYMPIVEGLIERKYPVNIWAYARVDTVHEETLGRLKKAGINWLALGIESADPGVRESARKKMLAKDINSVVAAIQGAGIRVIGNFMFGLPDDTQRTMQETLKLAMELNCEFVNFYCAMAYPGSRLYDIAADQGWELPKEWHGFSQHSYEMLPLPTKHLRADEVLRFRDEAFHAYFKNPRYLDMIVRKFGPAVKEHIGRMTATRLRRRILDPQL